MANLYTKDRFLTGRYLGDAEPERAHDTSRRLIESPGRDETKRNETKRNASKLNVSWVFHRVCPEPVLADRQMSSTS